MNKKMVVLMASLMGALALVFWLAEPPAAAVNVADRMLRAGSAATSAARDVGSLI